MITQDSLPMVAIASMNDTHLEEILLINRLESVAREEDIEQISAVLLTLLEHTKVHFSGEEEMMQETNFPAFEMHKNEHDRHLGELKSLVSKFDETGDVRAIIVYIEGYLTPWLKHHIETMDTMTALYLQQSSNKA